ncbi:MAG: Ig-like domain-containing protein, partial [Syntrophomonas sp.]
MVHKTVYKSLILAFLFIFLAGNSIPLVAAETSGLIKNGVNTSIKNAKLYPHAQKLYSVHKSSNDNKLPISQNADYGQNIQKESAQQVITVGSQSYEFDSFGFYDAWCYDPYSNDINFQDTFNSSETTYINWELWLHRLPESLPFPFPQTLTVEDIWYNSENEVVFQDTQMLDFRPGREYDWAFNGCGYPEPGQWEAGEYRVEILVNDQLITESTFQVINDSVNPVPIDGQTLQLDCFGFYDLGLFDPDSYVEYQDQFPLSTTTTVNWEMWLSRADSREYAEFTIEEDWYDPHNQNVCHKELPATMDAGWDQYYYYDGYTPPGGWEAGEYRVEIRIDNELVKTAFFSVVNDASMVIPIQSISLDENELFLVAGNQASLTAVITPTNATNQTISWKSTSPEIASVDQNGLVSALQEGTTTIIASDEDGQHVARCEVYVSAAAVSSETPVYRALLVGNADYPGTDSDLEGPPSDVERLLFAFAVSTISFRQVFSGNPL